MSGFNSDLLNLYDFCKRFYKGIGLEPQVAQAKLWGVLCEMETQLTKNVNIETPSVFKRASALTLAFMVRAPLDQNFKGGNISNDLIRIANHQNAIVSFEYCRDALREAVIQPSKREPFMLKNPIALSKHFYCDLIHSISHLADLGTCFHSTALLYESLSYKANPGAADPEIC